MQIELSYCTILPLNLKKPKYISHCSLTKVCGDTIKKDFKQNCYFGVNSIWMISTPKKTSL